MVSKEKQKKPARDSGESVTLNSPSTFNRTIGEYVELMGSNRSKRLRTVTTELSDTKVLHVNSTASGGGVAELLSSLLPLFNDIGVDSDWVVMDADDTFFDITKSLHNGLQGQSSSLTEDMKQEYRRVTQRNAVNVPDEYDIVVLHDPQSLGMVELLADRLSNTKFVWRCHIDLTSANKSHLSFIENYVRYIDHAVFSRHQYEQKVNGTSSSVIHPAIDPFAEKNRQLSRSEIDTERDRLHEIGFSAPVITQVSRFDPWKDQLGVVGAYRQLKDDFPDVQLVLVGGMADDDPEGEEIFDCVVEETIDDPDIHLLTNQPDITVNFLQRQSDIVLQKSLREGFGLVVAEALWKETPVIGSNVGGIPIQINDGKNGYLVEPHDQSMVAKKMEQLFRNDVHRQELGEQGKQQVRDRFLLPRQLLDFLELFTSLEKEKTQ